MELAADPLLDVGPPVTDVLANPKAGWAVTGVPPRIQCGDRYRQVLGELLRREQAIGSIHDPDSAAAPFQRSVRTPRLRRLNLRLWVGQVPCPAQSENALVAEGSECVGKGF